MADVDWIVGLLTESRLRLLAEVASLNDDQFVRSPGPGQWSAAQVLDHLGVLEGRLVPHFREMVAGTKPSTVSLFDRLRCLPPRLALWRGIKIRNPRVVSPADQPKPRPQLLDDLARTRAALLAFIEDTRGRDLSDHRLLHKALGGMNLYGWFEMVARHEERHRKQISESQRALGAS